MLRFASGGTATELLLGASHGAVGASIHPATTAFLKPPRPNCQDSRKKSDQRCCEPQVGMSRLGSRPAYDALPTAGMLLWRTAVGFHRSVDETSPVATSFGAPAGSEHAAGVQRLTSSFTGGRHRTTGR